MSEGVGIVGGERTPLQTKGPTVEQIDRTTELYVDGLTCGHCVASVTEEVSEVPGVKNVEVILNSGGTSRVTVVSDVLLDDEALRDAVSEAGYVLKEIRRD